MKKETKPWDQQPGEPNKAYSRFVMYRDMRSRSLRILGELLGMKSIRPLEKWSSDHGWQARVKAWDLELNIKSQETQTEDLKGMRQRHIQLGIGMQSAVIKELQALVHKIEAAAEDARQRAIREGRDPAKAFHEPFLSVRDIVRLSEHGTSLERLSRGEPTQLVQVEEGEKPTGPMRTSEEIAQEIEKLQRVIAGG